MYSINFITLTPLESLFKDSCDYATIVNRISSGNLKSLSQDDLAFFLDFLTRNGMLHRIAELRPQLLLELIDAGVNVNALDCDGYSILSKINDPNLFLKLLDFGADYGPTGTFLKHALTKTFPYYNANSHCAEWGNILPTILKKASVEHFVQLDKELMQLLIKLGIKEKSIGVALICLSSKISSEYPEIALGIARELICTLTAGSNIEAIKFSITKGALQTSFIEALATDPQIVFWEATRSRLYACFATYCKPSITFQLYINETDYFRDAAYFCALLKTKTLKDIARLLSQFNQYHSKNPEKMGALLLGHITALQNAEKSTIWMELGFSIFTEGIITRLNKIGISTKLLDANNRSFLFSTQMAFLEDIHLESLGFDTKQVDTNGDNALEYHCRMQNKTCIRVLAKQGLGLSDHFPNVEQCRNLFPGNLILQAFLGACLLINRKSALKELVKAIPEEQFKYFIYVLKQEPSLKFLLLKLIDTEKIVYKDWNACYGTDDFRRLSKIRDHKSCDAVCSIWEGAVPSSVINLIPESAEASLVVGAITKNHDKPIKVATLFGLLSHNGVVHLFRYIFNHPEILRLLISKYMVVKEILIKSGGSTISTHAKFVQELILKMRDLLHIPKLVLDVPYTHRLILEAFQKHIPPTLVNILKIPEQAKTTLQGRTVVLEKGECIEGFKFLRENEDYNHFSQEYSVSKTLRETSNIFKSQFIKPLGLYAIRQLPTSFDQYKSSLSGDRPAYIFHYESTPGKYRYLQNLSQEKYLSSRGICLQDSAKLVKMAIYPDTAPLFHNEIQKRKYIILVDLLVKTLRKDNHMIIFSPAGGAGRLDQPFAKTKYPNLTEIGLTDIRDATTYHVSELNFRYAYKDMRELKSKDSLYYQQMEALARILLVDMLILAERNKLNLDWQNDTFLKTFGDEIAQGFADIFSGYTDKPLLECLRFIRECGIDWSLAAKQIAFWLDVGPKGYPGWLAKNKVPDGLYEKNTKVVVNASGANNFNPDTGCTTNGNQDIGLYNGPLALAELEKALHLLVFAIGLAEPLEL